MSYKVLVVDDSKLARMSAIGALKSLRPEWRAIEVSDPTAAINVAEVEKPHMAFIDIHMQGKNGLTLLDELRQLRPAMPIIVISSNSQDEVVARVRSHQALFIRKPLSRDAFAELLEEAERQIPGASLREAAAGHATFILDEDQLDALIELVN
ncbi:MAG: response regulator, partial [Rhodospirillaceae bacterium]